MMKKATRNFPLVFSVLLLFVSVTVSASAQGSFVEGEIRWVNRFGVVPAGPGDTRAAPTPCSIFSVVALDARTKRPVAYTDQGASPFQFSYPQSVTYICRYSLKVPENSDLYIVATMGNVLYLPKTDRDPYLITGPWIADAGRLNKPPAGQARSLAGATHVTLRSGGTSNRKTVDFRMTWVSTEASEIDIPTFFAGAWQGKFGEGAFQLILQQAGDQVTGQLNINSALHKVTGGKVVGNTLRFTIVRIIDRPPLRPLELLTGDGELTMDAGGKSFTGTVLGTAIKDATFIGR